MKKVFSLFICIILCVSMVSPVFATTGEKIPTITNSIDGNEMQYMERMSLEEIEELKQDLPADLAFVLDVAPTDTDVVPYGVDLPDFDNTWDLSSKQYNFSANFSIGSIYSNYVFSGHGGSAHLNCTNLSQDRGQFSVSIYVVRDSKHVYHSGGWLSLNFSTGLHINNLKSSDIFFFSLNTPEGKHVKLTDEGINCSYLKKN